MTDAHIENDWQSALSTAAMFVAAFVTLLFGLLDASSNSQGYVVEIAVGAICAAGFIASLSSADARCRVAED